MKAVKGKTAEPALVNIRYWLPLPLRTADFILLGQCSASWDTDHSIIPSACTTDVPRQGRIECYFDNIYISACVYCATHIGIVLHIRLVEKSMRMRVCLSVCEPVLPYAGSIPLRLRWDGAPVVAVAQQTFLCTPYTVFSSGSSPGKRWHLVECRVATGIGQSANVEYMVATGFGQSP